MKRRIAIVAALATVAGVVTYAGLATAQTPAASAPSSGGTRIAVLNIAEMLRNYEHAKASGEYLTKVRQKYVDQVTKLRDDMTAKQEDLRKTDGSDKESTEKAIIELQRQIQDIDKQAQKEITKMADDSVTRIYSEVQYFVASVAKSHGYQLVLCYPGAGETTELEKPVIARMMLQTPAAMPFYHDPSIDITKVVTETANTWYQKEMSKTSTPAGGN